MNFDLLHSNRIYLVNCKVVDGLIKAGWAWCDARIQNNLEALITDELVGFSITILVPDVVRNLKAPTSIIIPNDTVDFKISGSSNA